MGFVSRALAWIKKSSGGSAAIPREGIDFAKLEKVLQHTIRQKQLFYEAFSHRSYLQIAGDDTAVSNERLEFLGDSVLNLVIAEYLFKLHSNAEEGELTQIRSRLVNRKVLNIYSRNLRLEDFILMSPSAMQIPGRGMETILSDAYEAVIGAIYLDGGYGEARQFVLRSLTEAMENGSVKTEDDNFKSRLLELSQAGGLGAPRYVTVSKEGPEHDRTFTVEVFIENMSYGTGFGKNKKDAEQAAAQKALEKFGSVQG